MEILHKGVVDRHIQHEVKPSAIFAPRPDPHAIFPVVHERKRYFNAMYTEQYLLYFPREIYIV